MSNKRRAFNSEIFAARLKLAREEKKLSQRQLAFQVGLSPRSLGQYEQGTIAPAVSSLVALATALQVSTDWLTGLSENQTRIDP